jgi:hypothetical protein
MEETTPFTSHVLRITCEVIYAFLCEKNHILLYYSAMYLPTYLPACLLVRSSQIAIFADVQTFMKHAIQLTKEKNCHTCL